MDPFSFTPDEITAIEGLVRKVGTQAGNAQTANAIKLEEAEIQPGNAQTATAVKLEEAEQPGNARTRGVLDWQEAEIQRWMRLFDYTHEEATKINTNFLIEVSPNCRMTCLEGPHEIVDKILAESGHSRDSWLHLNTLKQWLERQSVGTTTPGPGAKPVTLLKFGGFLCSAKMIMRIAELKENPVCVEGTEENGEVTKLVWATSNVVAGIHRWIDKKFAMHYLEAAKQLKVVEWAVQTAKAAEDLNKAGTSADNPIVL